MEEKQKKKMGRPMLGETKLKVKTFKISDENIKKLDEEAKNQKKTKSQIIRDLIEKL